MKQNLLGFSLLSLFLLFAGCGKNNSNTPPNQNPQNESEIQKIDYTPEMSDFLLIPNDSNSNIYSLSLPLNQPSILNLVVKAQNISGSVKSLTGYSDLIVPQACVKAYEENETCSIQVPISSTMSGIRVIRAATTKGNIYLRIFIQRTGSVAAGIPDVRVDSSIDYGAVSKNIVTKLISVKNYGADTTITKVSIAGVDFQSYSIVYNACLNKTIKKSSTCAIRITFDGRNKVNGNFTCNIVIGATGQEDISSAITSVVTDSPLQPSPPVIGLTSINAIAGKRSTVSVQASNNNGSPLTYSVSGGLDSSIDNNGMLTINPLANQSAQIVNLTVSASDGTNPATKKIIPVTIYGDLVYTGDSTFVEGDVKMPLMRLDLNMGKSITAISTNINSFITATKLTGTGVTALDRPLIKGTALPIRSGNNGTVSYQIEGAVKYAGSYDLTLNVTLSNNQVITYHKTITVTTAGRPYLKYDIWAVRTTSRNYEGYDGDEIGISILELKRQYGAWRTPIFVRLTNEPIVCNGNEMTIYDSDQVAMQNCIANKASVDAESAFYFDGVYSGSDRIGGIANGTRKSLVVEKSPWDYTLAHELGHQFGLWHTFETYWNDYLIHCATSSVASCYYYNLVENSGGKNISTLGDWANTRVDYFDQSGIVTLNRNVSDDTGTDYYGGKVIALNINSTAALFGYSNSPYSNGNQVVLSYGGQNYSSSSGFACLQNLSGGTTSQNGNNIRYYVSCSNIPDLGSFYMSNEVVKNTMSYWYHESNSARFSPNQKSRMDQVINQFSELSQP